MPQSQYITNQTNVKAGQVEIKENRGKLKFYAFNAHRGGKRHVGTLIGATYEKASQILQKPEPSLAVTASELEAVQNAGGEFIRFIVARTTYAISVKRFIHHAEKFSNPFYGAQLRVPVGHFTFSAAYQKRSAHRDSPVIESNEMVLPRDRQMELFR